MEHSYYMSNMQKLLFMVEVLHQRGYEKLRIVPSLSPTGLAWRCTFQCGGAEQGDTLIGSNWIHELFNLEEAIDHDSSRLADLFERDHIDFLKKCKGENNIYVDWYRNVLKRLENGELPYAFAEYFPPCDYWKTSKGNQIPTLPNEKDYYYNY